MAKREARAVGGDGAYPRVEAKARAQALGLQAQLLGEEAGVAGAAGREGQCGGEWGFSVQAGLAQAGFAGFDELDVQAQGLPAFQPSFGSRDALGIGQCDEQALRGLVVQAQLAAQLGGAGEAQLAERDELAGGVATFAAGAPAGEAKAQRRGGGRIGEIGHEGREQGAAGEAGLFGHAAATLEDLDLEPQGGQLIGRRDTGESGAHHCDAARHAGTLEAVRKGALATAGARRRLRRSMKMCILCGFCRRGVAVEATYHSAKRL